MMMRYGRIIIVIVLISVVISYFHKIFSANHLHK